MATSLMKIGTGSTPFSTGEVSLRGIPKAIHRELGGMIFRLRTCVNGC